MSDWISILWGNQHFLNENILLVGRGRKGFIGCSIQEVSDRCVITREISIGGHPYYGIRFHQAG